MASADYLNIKDQCAFNQYYGLNGTLMMKNYYVQLNSTTLKITKGPVFLTQTPGITNSSVTINGSPGFQTTTIVWTDYSSTKLKFSFAKTTNKTLSYFSINVRDRKFNDLDTLNFLFDIVQSYTTKTTFVNLYQGSLCHNQPGNVFP
jgi:hypothetical protein